MVKKDLQDIKYIKDPKFFFDKIEKKEPFALTRFGDGGVGVHILTKDQGRWGKVDESVSEEYLNALSYKAENYYIGLLFRMVDLHPMWIEVPYGLVTQEERFLTTAHIFSPMDWPRRTLRYEFVDWFLDKIELNKDIKINWICNVMVKKFSPKFINKFFFIESCQVKRCEENRIEILDYIKKTKGELFMFTAGAFSNIMIHRAWMMNRSNIYMNIGRALDPLYNKIYVVKGIITDEYKKRIKKWEKYILKK